MEAIIAYCNANYIARHTYVGADGADVYMVENQNPVGLIAAGALVGRGDSLEAALKEYMSLALDQRAVVKEPLTSYVAEPTADPAVKDAFGKDDVLAKAVAIEEPLADVKG